MASGSNRALAALAANRRVRRHGDAVSSPVLSRTTTPEPVTTPSSTNATPKNDTPTGPRTKQQYRTPPGTEAVSIRELKSLIEKTDHIDKYIKELEDKNSTIHSRKRLPRELSALVHDAYKQLKESEEVIWDFTVNFDHSSNSSANDCLKKNIQGLLPSDHSYTTQEIKRSMRVYFKSLKNRHQRQQRGTQDKLHQQQRRRQRMFNKSQNRLKALKESTTIDAATKKKLQPVLEVNYMSSDESVIISDEEVDTPSKKFVKHSAQWRSAEFQNYIDSLDRKVNRRRTERGKLMTIPVEYGEPSSRNAPDSCPEWACITLFD